MGNNGNFSDLFFLVTKISHKRNFDTIARPVRIVDGEILSEIAIHNFEKNQKIKIRILPYGQKMLPYHVPRSTNTESVI